jgi:hypothetical protein
MARAVSRRAKRTWDRLGSWYGSRLADQYGEHPPEDWVDLFDRTDDERLDQALSSVRHASPIHPPTLGQLENAIPRREVAGSPSRAQTVANAIMTRHGAEMCIHQLKQPWNYFGPVKDFISKSRGENGNEVIKHPEVRGVQVPACAECSKPTFRMLVDDIVTQGVRAA